jgi:hypothetical protein
MLDKNHITGINVIWKKLYEHGILTENQALHYNIKIEDYDREFSGEATATSEGILLENEPVHLTPSLALQQSMRNQQSHSTPLNMINGWPIWRDEYGTTLSELATQLPEITLSFNEPISSIIKKHSPEPIIKTNYMTFFGAGASMGAGIPSQAQLMNNILFSKIDEVTNTLTYVKFKEFYNRFFYYDTEKDWFPSTEHVFGFLDYFIKNNMSPGGKYNSQYLSVIKAYLIRLIQFEIKQKADDHLIHYNLAGPYFKFLQNMLSLGQTSSLITLNYDILLSNSFSSLFPFGVYLDYGLDLVNYRPSNFIDPAFNWIKPNSTILAPVNLKPKRIRALKLHGSTNWKYCDCCKSVFVSRWANLLNIDLRTMFSDDEYLKQKQEHPQMYCQTCNSRLHALITAPTYLKDFTQPVTTKLFKAFHDYIQQVNKIIFIGYSFPEADVHIKALFNSRLKPFDQVHVINPHMSDDSKGIYKSISKNYFEHKLTFDELVSDHSQFKKITSTLTRD